MALPPALLTFVRGQRMLAEPSALGWGVGGCFPLFPANYQPVVSTLNSQFPPWQVRYAIYSLVSIALGKMCFNKIKTSFFLVGVAFPVVAFNKILVAEMLVSSSISLRCIVPFYSGDFLTAVFLRTIKHLTLMQWVYG